MHGGGGNDTDWVKQGAANFILDNLLATHRIVPMVVVMPDANIRVRPGTRRWISSPQVELERDSRRPAGLPRVAGGPRTERWRIVAGWVAGLRPGAAPSGRVLYGDFSSGYFPNQIANLDKNHTKQLTSPAINRDTRLLWITVGGPGDIAYPNSAPTRALLDQYGIHYTFVQGTGDHVWDTWRHNLLSFAPLLFRHTISHHKSRTKSSRRARSHK